MDFINFSLSDINLFIILLVAGLVALTVIRRLLKYPPVYIFVGIIGLLLGLLLGDLLSGPLSRLPAPWDRWLPIFVTIIVAAAVVDFFLAQANSWSRLFNRLFALLPSKGEKGGFEIAVDTSVLIDGRIEELVKTGFVLGKLIIPRFVLDELQKVSDSEEPLKRTRGRRGFEILSRISKNRAVKTEILEVDFRERGVDKKLIRLAQQRNARLLTCDYNLNRLAEVSGINVLNINELSNALKPVVLPGESLKVKIATKGKEKGQGVGYLPDGTMIVVEEGGRLVGKEIDCKVERIYQTVAGKMIFAVPHGAQRT